MEPLLTPLTQTEHEDVIYRPVYWWHYINSRQKGLLAHTGLMPPHQTHMHAHTHSTFIAAVKMSVITTLYRNCVDEVCLRQLIKIYQTLHWATST